MVNMLNKKAGSQLLHVLALYSLISVSGMSAASYAQTSPKAEVADPAEANAALSAAFLYAYGPYEFASNVYRIMNDSADVVVSLNQVAHTTKLADHTTRRVTTPNNDTIYSSAVLELSSGPVELTAPSVDDRYFSIMFMDIFTDVFAFIGTRETGGEGGTFWVVGPDWEGDAPDGVKVIRATSNDIWVLGRFFVAGPEDLDAARAVQSQFSVKPIEGTIAKPFQSVPLTELNAENMINVVNELFQRSPDHPHIKRAEAFARFGLSATETDTWSSLPEKVQTAWQSTAEQVLVRLKAGMSEAQQKGAWSIPPENLGYYGDDDLTRAIVSLVGFGAFTLEEAAYYSARQDSFGEPLTGDKVYTVSIPTNDVPVSGFWSLSVYSVFPDGRRFFEENPINRFAVNNATPNLVKDEQGDLMLYLSTAQPDDDNVNWIPLPAGEFSLVFRAYLPEEPMLNMSWPLPGVLPITDADILDEFQSNDR